jgi:hypothetical protein
MNNPKFYAERGKQAKLDQEKAEHEKQGVLGSFMRQLARRAKLQIEAEERRQKRQERDTQQTKDSETKFSEMPSLANPFSIWPEQAGAATQFAQNNGDIWSSALPPLPSTTIQAFQERAQEARVAVISKHNAEGRSTPRGGLGVPHR